MLEASDIYSKQKYREATNRAGDFLVLAQMPDPQSARRRCALKARRRPGINGHGHRCALTMPPVQVRLITNAGGTARSLVRCDQRRPTQNSFLLVRINKWPCAAMIDERIRSSLGSSMEISFMISPSAALTTTTVPTKLIR